MHLGRFDGSAGRFCQTTEPTPTQRQILAKLDIPAPAKVLDLATPTRA